MKEKREMTNKNKGKVRDGEREKEKEKREKMNLEKKHCTLTKNPRKHAPSTPIAPRNQESALSLRKC